MIMAKSKTKKKAVRPKPLSPKAGVTRNAYGKGGKTVKKKS